MANIILVDFTTLRDRDKRAAVKDYVTEYLVRHPETAITVLNSEWGAVPLKTVNKLKKWAFMSDTVACNPLELDVPPITFKTMFAVSLQERDEHEVVLVIDEDVPSLEMWKSSGIKFLLAPSAVGVQPDADR